MEFGCEANQEADDFGGISAHEMPFRPSKAPDTLLLPWTLPSASRSPGLWPGPQLHLFFCLKKPVQPHRNLLNTACHKGTVRKRRKGYFLSGSCPLWTSFGLLSVSMFSMACLYLVETSFVGCGLKAIFLLVVCDVLRMEWARPFLRGWVCSCVAFRCYPWWVVFFSRKPLQGTTYFQAINTKDNQITILRRHQLGLKARLPER